MSKPISMNGFGLVSFLALSIMANLLTMREAKQSRKDLYYYKDLSKPSHNVHQKSGKWSIYRRANNFNYNYEDWENKTLGVYDDYFFITSTPSSINVTNSTVSSTSEYPTTRITTTTGETPTTRQVTKSSLQAETVSEANSVDTGPETTSVGSNITSQDVNTDTALTSNAAESVTSELPANDSLPTTTAEPTKNSSMTTNPLVEEITSLKIQQRGGYFSASLIVLMKIIATKNPEDVSPLIGGLHGEIVRLNAEHHLAFFGGTVVELFNSMALFLLRTPVEVVQIQAKYTSTLLVNRKTEVPPDANAIIDVVDTIYNEEDVQNIAKFLDDVKKYPNTDQTALDIARMGLEAIVLKPHDRIIGTPRERLLMMEINNVVKNRMNLGEMAGGRRNVMKDRFRSGYEASGKSWKTRYLKTKAYLRTEVTSDEAKYTDYVRNKTIMKKLKNKMRNFKKKMKDIRGKDRQKGTKRGPSTTMKTTTTTTVRPAMYKSKYYMRKYVKKNLYKMKTSTIKTTKFQWRYHGEIRKFNIDRRSSCEANANASVDSSIYSNKANESEEIHSESDSNYETSDLRFRYTEPNKIQIPVRAISKIKDEMSKSEDKTNKNVFYSTRGYKAKLRIEKKETIEAKSTEKKDTTEDKSTENQDTTDDKSTEKKDNTEAKSTEIKDTTEDKSTEKKDTTDDKSTEKKDTTEAKSIEKKDTTEAKSTEKKDTTEAKSTEKKDTTEAKSTEKKDTTEDKWTENSGTIETKSFVKKEIIEAKSTQKKETIETKSTQKKENIVSDLESNEDAEKHLKANIDDAVFHKEKLKDPENKRRHLKVRKRVIKLGEVDSFSDDEAMMKGRIYQVFGYSGNFAKQIRTMKTRRYTFYH